MNGVTLVLEKNDYVGRAAIFISIAAGSINDPDSLHFSNPKELL